MISHIWKHLAEIGSVLEYICRDLIYSHANSLRDPQMVELNLIGPDSK